MARKTKEELEKIKKKYNTDTLWSWSKYNCYKNSPYEYFLKYIEKIPEDNQPSIYLVQGGGVHDILEQFYENKIEYKDMIDKYENLLFDLQMADMKYNRVDEDANLKIGNKYVLEHRIIMEAYLNRKLKRNETIHHKDMNKLNNDISNLEVLSRAEHSRLHSKLKKKEKGVLNEKDSSSSL